MKIVIMPIRKKHCSLLLLVHVIELGPPANIPGMSVGAVRAARRAVDGGEAVHGRRHALAARAPAPARTHATPRSPYTTNT